MSEAVDHPDHYGGKFNPYEAIKVVEAWDLGFCLGNTVKYISRAGKKGDRLEDLQKALWYLQREVDRLERQKLNSEVAHVSEALKDIMREGTVYIELETPVVDPQALEAAMSRNLRTVTSPPLQGDIRYVNPDGAF